MMDPFSVQLNEVLVETFRTILKVEEEALKTVGKGDLSITEMHLLEAVGKGKAGGATISDIALSLGITLPTVTIAINKLAKKGYVEKIRGESDGRTVLVTLTREGRRMDAGHRYFHEQMVRYISAEFNEEDKRVLLKGVAKLSSFFKNKLPITAE